MSTQDLITSYEQRLRDHYDPATGEPLMVKYGGAVPELTKRMLTIDESIDRKCTVCNSITCQNALLPDSRVICRNCFNMARQ